MVIVSGIGELAHLALLSAIMIPGTLALPIGLLMNGWGAEKHVHWIVPDIVRPLVVHADP